MFQLGSRGQSRKEQSRHLTSSSSRFHRDYDVNPFNLIALGMASDSEVNVDESMLRSLTLEVSHY